MTLWLDIDDLLSHLDRFSRPSGIQRVVYEASAALRRQGGDSVAFVRRGRDARDFRVVEWSDVEAAFQAAMSRIDEQEAGQPVAPRPEFAQPGDIRDDDLLQALGRAERRVAGGVMSLACGLSRLGARRVLDWEREISSRLRGRRAAATGQSAVIAPPAKTGARLADLARPGDVFLTLGAPWHHADYGQTVRWLRDDLRVSFALLIHDLVPLRHPEWCDRGIIQTFKAWHETIFPLADAVFTLSQATADDVTRYLEEQKIRVPKGVVPVSAGTVCNLSRVEIAPAPVVEGPYVLFVSTIEARKNHVLLFRLWRKFVSELPREQVPTLVFAGREGWLVSDLMRQLENTDWLEGKIRFVRNPTDSELHRLYADCLFTVFPSFFEGWGLPVTESLSMGKPCVASNTTSIPEAGGNLARYFNPYDAHDAYRVIRDVIMDSTELSQWTDRVRAEFRPAPWDRSAEAMLETLRNH